MIPSSLSEHQAQRHLNLAIGSRVYVFADGRAELPKAGTGGRHREGLTRLYAARGRWNTAAKVGCWIGEIAMIHDVVNFAPEFEFGFFSNRELLSDTRVELGEARPSQRIVTEVSEGAGQGNGKRSWIQPESAG